MSDQTGEPVPDAMQLIFQILQDHEDRITKVCEAHEDLDKEIHEDFFGPIHETWQSSQRANGIADLKDRYGKTLGDITDDQWAGFGIDDLFGRLYDEIQKLKGGEGWGPEAEQGWIQNIHDQAMDRIKKISGGPTVPKEETPEAPAAVEVEVKKTSAAPTSAKEKLSEGKKRMGAGKGIIGGY